MIKKTIYPLILLFLLCLSLLIYCKADNKKKLKNESDSGSVLITENVDSENKGLQTPTSDETIEDSLLAVKSAVENKVEKKSTENSQEVEETEIPITKKPIKVKAKSYKTAKIEFEELYWDFGEITEGDIVEKKFKFTNTGKAPLKIISTSATCGCTRPSFPFLDIAPGESHFIGVTYNSVGKAGEQNPEVTIESNSNPKKTILKLRGMVKPKENYKNVKSESNVRDTINSKQ